MYQKNKKKPLLVRVTTIAGSLDVLLKGQSNYMSNYFNVIAISTKSQRFKEYSERENIQIIEVEMARHISLLKDIKALIRLYFIFKKIKPDIVHTHTPKAGLLGMLSAKLSRVKVRLHTVAGLPLMEQTGFKRMILNFFEKLTYFCSTKVYPNSRGLMEFIIKEKFTRSKKLKLIGNGSSNGIDLDYFDPNIFNEIDKSNLKQKNNIPKDSFVFIFIGRIVKDKGIEELVDSFNNLTKLNNNTVLLLLGKFENKLDPISERTLKIMNSNKRILQIGFVDDIRPYLAISNVLVHPSYREGFPNVVLQACVFNLPCIVTNINGSNEIIDENINGIIVPVKNKERLFLSMKKISSDGNLYNKLSGKSRSTIEEKYSREYVWNELLIEYQRNLKN